MFAGGDAFELTRSDCLNSTLLGSGSLLLTGVSPRELPAREDWDGYSGVRDYPHSNGNTYEALTDGHRIRDPVVQPMPENVMDTGEEYDCTVIGGGIGGLPAESRRRHTAAPVRCCRDAQAFTRARLFRCSPRVRHEEDLSHLDVPAGGGDAFARPCQRLVHVSAFQYPKTADVFLGL